MFILQKNEKKNVMFYRNSDSAAGSGGGSHHHSAGAASPQSQAGVSVENKTKVAESWGAFLCGAVCLQWRQVC